ncbi:MAG: ImmA/IrrE family metallo-endopeptidase [Clostridia bacterium]|nr:ImmA/IrrE family metallo-endopeptidase [Clostridia bacterium]
MTGKNIRYYRLLREMSQESLAKEVALGKMAISNYESGKRTPDYATLLRIAKALDVSLASLLAQDHDELTIWHGPFRTHVTQSQQEVIRGTVERYLGRLLETVSFVGEAALPPVPTWTQAHADDIEEAGRQLRAVLGLPENGPVGNLTDILENNGFLVCPVVYDASIYAGHIGTVNGRPFIAINTALPAVRRRLTLVHALAHLVYVLDDRRNEECFFDAVASAFLLPKADIVRELGPRRTEIRGDLRLIQREYGVCRDTIVMRAWQAKIISRNTYDATRKWIESNELYADEHAEGREEKPHLLEQMVLRAVNEGEIGLSKAAELLEIPFTDVRQLCCPK